MAEQREDETQSLVFEKCPNCGSTNSLANKMAKSEIEKGRMDPKMDSFIFIFKCTVIDNNRAAILPIGAELPAYDVNMDMCADCGTLWGRKVVIGSVKLTGMTKSR